ncbi:hypothetical protein AND_007093 [Anopheles darlingi]|uniref:Uncharacterized protein n=1 Tax=Anopheles darlingi TaxID=43151 RepID=W5J9Y0_ANODA|nr:hypothetical protein AND_007093 [Anopheles darlingi]
MAQRKTIANETPLFTSSPDTAAGILGLFFLKHFFLGPARKVVAIALNSVKKVCAIIPQLQPRNRIGHV